MEKNRSLGIVSAASDVKTRQAPNGIDLRQNNRKWVGRVKKFVLIPFAVSGIAFGVEAKQVEIIFDPHFPPGTINNVIGYNFYYGPGNGSPTTILDYTNVIQVGGQFTFVPIYVQPGGVDSVRFVLPVLGRVVVNDATIPQTQVTNMVLQLQEGSYMAIFTAVSSNGGESPPCSPLTFSVTSPSQPDPPTGLKVLQVKLHIRWSSNPTNAVASDLPSLNLSFPIRKEKVVEAKPQTSRTEL